MGGCSSTAGLVYEPKPQPKKKTRSMPTLTKDPAYKFAGDEYGVTVNQKAEETLQRAMSGKKLPKPAENTDNLTLEHGPYQSEDGAKTTHSSRRVKTLAKKLEERACGRLRVTLVKTDKLNSLRLLRSTTPTGGSGAKPMTEELWSFSEGITSLTQEAYEALFAAAGKCYPAVSATPALQRTKSAPPKMLRTVTPAAQKDDDATDASDSEVDEDSDYVAPPPAPTAQDVKKAAAAAAGGRRSSSMGGGKQSQQPQPQPQQQQQQQRPPRPAGRR